jgi:hypothetical protein
MKPRKLILPYNARAERALARMTFVAAPRRVFEVGQDGIPKVCRPPRL